MNNLSKTLRLYSQKLVAYGFTIYPRTTKQAPSIITFLILRVNPIYFQYSSKEINILSRVLPRTISDIYETVFKTNRNNKINLTGVTMISNDFTLKYNRLCVLYNLSCFTTYRKKITSKGFFMLSYTVLPDKFVVKLQES